MFKQLKIKLTLINMASISIVLLSIFCGIYLFMVQGNEAQAMRTMKDLVKFQGRPQPPSANNGRPGHGPVMLDNFYVRTDTSGNILSVSPNIQENIQVAQNAATSALENNKPDGVINVDGLNLRYMKAEKDSEIFIVFLDKARENSMINQFILISVVVGIISLLLTGVISLFLASRALIPIKYAWEKQHEFVANASHELRTPLTVIDTNLAVVMGNSIAEDQRKWLDNIHFETQRMSRLVSNLLFLARSDSYNQSLELRPFNLGDVLSKISLSFEAVMFENGITFLSQVPSNLEYTGNEEQIGQLCVILLDNAVKNTDTGGKISLSAERNNEGIKITVSDNGHGISKEHIEKIFERFYRVDKSRSRTSGGYGLGLSIARCIVENHKGKISVESVPFVETKFTVVLPV